MRNNDLATLRRLIRESGVKARDARGNSPRMYSAALGSLESMRLLLDVGADPNAANDFAATPLMWCADDAAKVRLLLSKSADANARSRLGRTPLTISAAYDDATEARGPPERDSSSLRQGGVASRPTTHSNSVRPAPLPRSAARWAATVPDSGPSARGRWDGVFAPTDDGSKARAATLD
jgi:hypothetical protein